jgi:hypothetical protein
MTLHQRLAWGYAALFLTVVLLSHWPGLTDQDGNLFGQFHIDPIDDAIHALSFAWAAVAAWRSEHAARWYFRLFGAYYTADALLGLFTGWAVPELLVNFSIAPGYNPADVLGNLPPNIPHFILGPAALVIGFVLPGTQRVVLRPVR